MGQDVVVRETQRRLRHVGPGAAVHALQHVSGVARGVRFEREVDEVSVEQLREFSSTRLLAAGYLAQRMTIGRFD